MNPQEIVKKLTKEQEEDKRINNWGDEALKKLENATREYCIEQQIEKWKTASRTLYTMKYQLDGSKIEKLKVIARHLGLPISGRKKEIIRRILEKINPGNAKNTFDVSEGLEGIVIL